MRRPLFAALLLLAACGGSPAAPVAVGEPAPSFQLSALDGSAVASSDLAGRATVLSFWATWCKPCFAEIPLLNELHAEGRVQVVTIALDEEGARIVAPFVAKQGILYPVLLGNQQTFQRFDGLTIPYTLLLHPDGRIAHIYRGALTRDRLRADLAGMGG